MNNRHIAIIVTYKNISITEEAHKELLKLKCLILKHQCFLYSSWDV